MSLSYNRLWKLLIDRGMTKQDLRKITGLSSASIAKLGKGQNVNTEMLIRICNALNCDLHDIVETVHDDKLN
ncbi:MAG: XRE family transcriptional regulator [Erysipelotrichia bacterium]|nr:XRE family transcriptional regulator [Erysipelotrichia bacterium]